MVVPVNGIPDEEQKECDQSDDEIADKAEGFVDPAEAYDALNNFRTKANVWVWNEDNITMTYYNTHGILTLKELQKDVALEQAARIRAKEIAENFSHVRPNNTLCFTAYPSGLLTEGENIACGYDSGRMITELWKETDCNYKGQAHRRNMLESSFTHVGIAGYKKNGTTYWVQAFGGK